MRTSMYYMFLYLLFTGCIFRNAPKAEVNDPKDTVESNVDSVFVSDTFLRIVNDFIDKRQDDEQAPNLFSVVFYTYKGNKMFHIYPDMSVDTATMAGYTKINEQNVLVFYPPTLPIPIGGKSGWTLESHIEHEINMLVEISEGIIDVRKLKRDTLHDFAANYVEDELADVYRIHSPDSLELVCSRASVNE